MAARLESAERIPRCASASWIVACFSASFRLANALEISAPSAVSQIASHRFAFLLPPLSGCRAVLRRSPMRLVEARITLGVVAARQGDLEQAIHYGECALSAPRKSLPSLLMVSRDLTRVLNDQYSNEPETQAYLDQLHSLSSLRNSSEPSIEHNVSTTGLTDQEMPRDA
jgi:hypothetical protein